MRPLLVAAVLVPLVSLSARVPGEEPTPARAGREWESRFMALPSPDNMREAMRRLSARPHHVGSAYGKENAEWILARFREWGWDAQIETFDVLFPTPKERLVEMIEPTRFRLALDEPALAVDPTSGQKAEQLPTYNAYSIDGDVTGPLVYVNYGLPEDYEELERLGISVKGKIVLARYGALLARDQAEGGGRARRRRLPHLLGPARRRLLRGRRVPEGPDAPEGRRAARQRDGHPVLEPRRPADAGRGRDAGGEAARRQGGAEPHADPGAAHLLRRRPAAPRRSRGAAGARGLAGRAARSRTTSARARRRCTSRSRSTGTSSPSTTSSRASPEPSGPTSGSCAATTTTPG